MPNPGVVQHQQMQQQCPTSCSHAGYLCVPARNALAKVGSRRYICGHSNGITCMACNTHSIWPCFGLISPMSASDTGQAGQAERTHMWGRGAKNWVSDDHDADGIQPAPIGVIDHEADGLVSLSILFLVFQPTTN